MKKEFKDFIKPLGGISKYSGNKRIMYITPDFPNHYVGDIEKQINERFSNTLPFNVVVYPF